MRYRFNHKLMTTQASAASKKDNVYGSETSEELERLTKMRDEMMKKANESTVSVKTFVSDSSLLRTSRQNSRSDVDLVGFDHGLPHGI